MDKISTLTEREVKILNLVKEELTNQEIAKILNISFHTVKAHLSSINRKLETNSKLGAVLEAVKAGYIKI